jgi:hypothetical protein
MQVCRTPTIQSGFPAVTQQFSRAACLCARVQVFRHLHELDLQFHLSRQTGEQRACCFQTLITSNVITFWNQYNTFARPAVPPQQTNR